VSWSRIQLGGNVVIGTSTTDTTVLIGGVPLFRARASDDGRLLLSADLYADHGRRLGSFTSHVWQTPQRGAELLVAPKRVTVRYRDTYAILLSVCLREDELIVTNMDLETRDGKRCVLDPSGRLVVWAPGAQAPTSHRGAIWHGELNRIDVETLTTNITVPSEQW